MKDNGRHPVWLLPGSTPEFPDPRDFGPHGLIAGGGDLSPERLVAAYISGIFPWYDDRPVLWWSPDPRTVLAPGHLHVSRSLRRRMRKQDFSVTIDRAPAAVLDGCADRAEGTWLNAEMKAAYLELFDLGHLRTYEVWLEGELVGGLYGVLVGGLFAAESMFHRATDASKVALVAAVTHTFASGVRLFDVQFRTEHLGSLGAREISRSEYLDRLTSAVARERTEPVGADPRNLLPWVNEHLPERFAPGKGAV